MKHLRDQIISLSIAAILLLYAIGIAMPALTPIPAFAPSDNTDDDLTTGNTDDDLTTGNTDDDLTTGNTNDYNDILLFLIDVVECFTNNGEEFSDDVQLCLYDVIEVYFDDNDNNVNSNDDSPDSDNNNVGSNDNNDNTDTNEDTDNTYTPSQET